MKCCAKCLGDKGLEKEIIPLRSDETGTCSFCLSENVSLIDPIQLSEYFELLVSIYEPDPDGNTLVHWLKEDWALFDHPRMDNANARALLSEILDDGEIVRKRFLPSPISTVDRMAIWSDFKEELMHQNRFFPVTDIDEDRLEELLSRLIADEDENPEYWHRARIQNGECAYDLHEMSAPPKRIASHGRANPAGIPYLYLGSTEITAVAEIRPHPGEIACVAKFRIPAEIKVVDLRNPRKLVSPFLLSDEYEIALLREDIEFLENLGIELTTPVIPSAAAIDYIPSQYLCEFIKRCGFKGVLYLSSISDGYNLALFDPELGEPIEISQYSVSKVLVEINSC